MVTVHTTGSWAKTEKWLANGFKMNLVSVLRKGGQRGVDALSRATPVESGLASSSWGYEIQAGKSSASIVWTNADIENGFPVAIMLQYGYGTGTGGYVQGEDYINPAMRPIFNQIATEVWKAVMAA